MYLPVDGGLSQWTAWSPCSKSCGGGTSVRTRQCNSPPPSPGGNPCNNKTFESKDCNIHACPGELLWRLVLLVYFTECDLFDSLILSPSLQTLQQYNQTNSQPLVSANSYIFLLLLFRLLFVLSKWMVAGRVGPTGQCVTRLAGVVNNSEPVVATVQHLLMVGSLVLGRT